MVLVDLPLAQLREYRCPRPAPTGHREFWDRTLAESRAAAGEPRCEPVASGLAVVDSYDVTLSGFGGAEVRGWWPPPRGASRPLPVVEGCPGSRGRPGHV